MIEPTVFDGDKKVVWVDIPTRECVNNDECYWENLAQFETREEAIAFIREHIDPNCDDEGRICLLTESR